MKETKEINGDAFVRNMLLALTFFTLTPVALFTSIFSLFILSQASIEQQVLGAEAEEYNLIHSPKAGVQVYASLPSVNPVVSVEAKVMDARPEIIRQYLEHYNSPLEPYANYIVAMADKYGLDFRLTTAIAQQESNLCKKIPPESYNCWGWGIHSQGTLGFADYEMAIETVSRGLREDYLDKGYATAEDIMAKYTPLSNGSWANGVDTFMGEME